MGTVTDILERLQSVVRQGTSTMAKGPRYVQVSGQYASTKEKVAVHAGKRIVHLIAAAAVLLFILSSIFRLPPGFIDSPEASSKNRDFEMFNLLGEFDVSGIRQMCEHKHFEKGLYFRCDEHDGGVGNVKNSILLCTRYAIEMGGHLVSPRMHLRSATDLAEIYGATMSNMSYMFDEDLYARRVEESCPGMRIYRTVEDIPEFLSLQPVPDILDPLNLRPHGWLLNTNVQTLKTDLQTWLQGQLGSAYSPGDPVLVNLERTLFGWSNHQDSYETWSQWGKLLQFQPEIYGLAASVMSLLAGGPANSMYETTIMFKDFRFVGQHLRTEADSSAEMQVFGFEPQMEVALRVCQDDAITDLYVASGDESEGAKAATRGAELGINVHTKYSLMANSPQLQQAIENLTFDQQALVDYLILLKATKFVGVDSSSFSGQIAVTRHAYAKTTFWQDFSDDLSILVGDRYPWLRYALWP